MKTLHFTFRGQPYLVNKKGQINANGINHFSPTWLFLGATRRHWSNRIEFNLQDAFTTPTLLNGCLGWDKDNGTTRQWGGSYCGKLPRIQNAYVTQ